ncbi:MAG TPA: hypothetical protein VF995_06205 [Actinomycetota bacterium]
MAVPPAPLPARGSAQEGLAPAREALALAARARAARAAASWRARAWRARAWRASASSRRRWSSRARLTADLSWAR